MKKTAAEPMIVQEWRSWASEHVPPSERRNSQTAVRFFDWLQQERSWLLDFTSSGDKWQDVHTMLLRRKEVID